MVVQQTSLHSKFFKDVGVFNSVLKSGGDREWEMIFAHSNLRRRWLCSSPLGVP